MKIDGITVNLYDEKTYLAYRFNYQTTESYGAFIYKCISHLFKRFRNSRTERGRCAYG